MNVRILSSVCAVILGVHILFDFFFSPQIGEVKVYVAIEEVKFLVS
jgi:hypothetical protein